MKSSFDNQESPAKRAPTPEEMRDIAAGLRKRRYSAWAEEIEAAADALAEQGRQEAEDIVACIRSTSWGGTEEIVEMIRRRHRKPSPPSPAKEGKKT